MGAVQKYQSKADEMMRYQQMKYRNEAVLENGGDASPPPPPFL